MKKLVLVFATLVATTSLVGCNKNNSNSQRKDLVLENLGIYRDDEFGGAYIQIPIANFNDAGFKFGDSVDLTFSNDVKVEDIGYYSGYYVPAGQELLVGYKGYPAIKYCINYGEDVYTKNNFQKDTKVTISLREEGRYKKVEETLSMSYSDDRNGYTSDEQFANFRPISVGRMKENIIYRGASPVDNSRKRAAIVDSLLEKNHIAYNVDLADKEENLGQEKYQMGNYLKGLKDNNKAVFLGMAAAYKADEFSNKMKTMFEAMLANDGPYYIHCLEGKDRTGYVCMVLEALCGATYQELIDDYFVTYQNYYGIEKGSEKYEVIKELHIDEMIKYVFGFEHTVGLLGAPYHTSATNYLLNIGLSQDQIDALQEKLSN